MKRTVTLIMLIIWMAVIFCFSAQNGTQSMKVSQSVGYGIAEGRSSLLHKDKQEEKLAEQVEAMQFVVRKGAHMTEYALLAVFFLLHMCTYRKRSGRFWLWAWGFCTAFAATDELHQWFVPGRDGRFQDVCIDSAGCLIGILIFMLCYRHFKKKRLSAEKAES